MTVLVGKNESGKTAFLEALHKSLALDGTKFEYVADYPRKDLVQYRALHAANQYQKAVQLTFRIERALSEKINKGVFFGDQIVVCDSTFSKDVSMGNTCTIGFDLDEKSALEALNKALGDLEHKDDVFASASTLDSVLTKIEALKLASDSKLAAFAV